MSIFVRSCKILRYFVFAKIRKVGDFSKASGKKDIGFISFSGTQYQKQINTADKQDKQTRVTVLHTIDLYELYQTLD